MFMEDLIAILVVKSVRLAMLVTNANLAQKDFPAVIQPLMKQ